MFFKHAFYGSFPLKVGKALTDRDKESCAGTRKYNDYLVVGQKSNLLLIYSKRMGEKM